MIELAWIGFAFVVGLLANSRGRSGFAWGFLALVFSPLLIGIVLLLSGVKAGPQQALEIVQQMQSSVGPEGEGLPEKLANIFALKSQDLLSYDEALEKKKALIREYEKQEGDDSTRMLVRLLPLHNANFLTKEDMEEIRIKIESKKTA